MAAEAVVAAGVDVPAIAGVRVDGVTIELRLRVCGQRVVEAESGEEPSLGVVTAGEAGVGADGWFQRDRAAGSLSPGPGSTGELNPSVRAGSSAPPPRTPRL